MERVLMTLRQVVMWWSYPSVLVEFVAGSVGVVLLDGVDSLRVDDSSSLSSPTVVDGSSGLPSSMSCTSAGRLVEAERNSSRLLTVWTGRTFNLMAMRH